MLLLFTLCDIDKHRAFLSGKTIFYDSFYNLVIPGDDRRLNGGGNT